MRTKMNRAAWVSSVAAAAAIVFGMSGAAHAATVYSDDFSGAGGPLNGAAPDVSPAAATWTANSPFLDNGAIDGTVEGGALLPFSPQANFQYTLSLDVLNPTGNWVALGFARDPIATPGADNVNDRLSNEPEGISWMLYRDVADSTQDIQLFAGLRTANGIADTNPAFDASVSHNLEIVITTAADGTNFTADFFLDDVSLLAAGPVTITRNIDDINFVGMAFDDATMATTIRVDNFTLSEVAVPEPASLGLLALAGLALGRRRRA